MLTKNSTIETAVTTGDNMYQLLDLMYTHFKSMGDDQKESLVGLCYELSCQISTWMNAEEKRRNG